MRARLFDSEDEEALAFLEELLAELGIELDEPKHVLGVEMQTFLLDDQLLTLHTDQNSVELEGPKSAVEEILSHFRQPLE